MNCPHCGSKQKDTNKFCENCGAPLNKPMQYIPEGIYACDDGKFRWVYEINLWKKNVIIISLIKVFLIVTFFVLAPVLFLKGLFSSGFSVAILSVLTVVPMFLLFFAFITLISYVIVAVVNGGKYCAVFTMDDEKIIHSQSQKQIDKGRILGLLSTLISKDIVNGMTVLASEKFTSFYRDVKTIKLEKKNNLIRVNEALIKNQIYVEPHQFDFVAGYILSRCPEAIIKKG